MIDPSTEPLPIETALARLADGATHYYLKSSSIVESVEHNGRTFYSKFRRIDAPVNPILIRQHLHREITLALPLLKEGRGDRLILEYLGEDPKRFLQTFRYLLTHLDRHDTLWFRGRHPHRYTVVLPCERKDLDALHTAAEEISRMLQIRLNKSWRILPDRRLPEAYNIYTLPYGYIN